jgi:DNA-binding CsgD family transcriptional regulator
MAAIEGLGSPTWLENVGRAAAAIGSDAFYDRLLDLACRLIRHDKSMVVRYSRVSAPQCLLYRDYPEHIIELWLSGYYRFDPFYDYWREHERCGVTTLSMISPPRPQRNAFWHVFLRQAQVADEIAFFLPAVGRASIALFIERAQRRFTAAEIKVARHAYPVLAGLHHAHVASVFANLANQNHADDAGKIPAAMLLVDRAGKRVHVTDRWLQFERMHLELAAAVADVGSGRRRHADLPDGYILHVETLANDFPLAPGGTIYSIERSGLPPIRLRYEDALSEFLRGQITPRERQIVELILAGYSNEAITKRLGISTGTVKNHRKRLYYKLDITSERELFALFLASLLDSGGGGGAPGLLPPAPAAFTSTNVWPHPAMAKHLVRER